MVSLKEKYNLTLKEVKRLEKYEEGYNILLDYWDSIADEEKPRVDKCLKAIGL
jgi:hypothetical protein